MKLEEGQIRVFSRGLVQAVAVELKGIIPRHTNGLLTTAI